MRKIKVFFIFLTFVLLIGGCQQSAPTTEIELYTSKSEKTEPKGVNNSQKKIRVALASVISPKASLSKYNNLLNYLGSEMDATIDIVQKQTYQEVDNMLKAGEVDFAFICSLSYVIGQKGQYIVDVAAPVVNGRPIYKSYTIVNQNSSYETLSELEGRKFAFTDPYSYTGRLSILSQLNQTGKSAEQFFSNTYFTYSHDYSVKAVALGIVDGATIDGVIFDKLQKDNPDLSSQVRIIGTGEEAGTPPVVASKKVDPTIVEEFSTLLLNLQNNTKGQKILKDLGVERYVPIDKNDYEIIKNELFLLGETP